MIVGNDIVRLENASGFLFLSPSTGLVLHRKVATRVGQLSFRHSFSIM